MAAQRVLKWRGEKINNPSQAAQFMPRTS